MVIPLSTGSRHDDAELRYALRSMCRYFEDLGRVWVIGHRPAWLRNVEHIPARDDHPSKDVNIIRKLELACRQEKLSERFVFWSDDRVLLRPLAYGQLGPYTWGDMASWTEWRSCWHWRVKAIRDWLAARRLPTFHCDVHVPIPMKRTVLLDLAQRTRDAWEAGDGMTVGTWYCNQAAEPQRLADRKATIEGALLPKEVRQRLAGRWFLGHDDAGFTSELRRLLDGLFPENCRFEERGHGLRGTVIPLQSTNPLLSVVVVSDVEKPEDMLEHFFTSLREFNSEGMEETDVVVLSQHANDRQAHKLASAQPFPVDVVHARHPFVGNYPLWDVQASIRRLWAVLRGKYITFCHPEFFLCPGRLRKTLDWLNFHRPHVVLGNLRRLKSDNDAEFRKHRSSPALSAKLTGALLAARLQEARELADALPTSHWEYWKPAPALGDKPIWQEDVFFASKAWMHATRFLEHADRLLFQDLYDLMSATRDVLSSRGLMPPCRRMPERVHRAIHLYHLKTWGSWSPAVRESVLADPRYRGTTLHDRELWIRLESLWQSASDQTDQPVLAMRMGVGGTVIRFRESFERWIDQEGGADELRDFYVAS